MTLAPVRQCPLDVHWTRSTWRCPTPLNRVARVLLLVVVLVAVVSLLTEVGKVHGPLARARVPEPVGLLVERSTGFGFGES